MRKILRHLSGITVGLLATLSPIVPKAYAQCDTGQENLNLIDCYILRPGKTVGEVYDTPTALVNLVVRNLFIIAGILIFFLIIAAGFQFVTGGVKGKDQAAQTIQTAVTGFLLMFAAYWIVQIIKVLTGAQILL